MGRKLGAARINHLEGWVSDQVNQVVGRVESGEHEQFNKWVADADQETVNRMYDAVVCVELAVRIEREEEFSIDDKRMAIRLSAAWARQATSYYKDSTHPRLGFLEKTYEEAQQSQDEGLSMRDVLEANMPLTVDEVAVYMRISRNSVYNYIKNGWIPAHKLPGERGYRFYRNEIDEWLKSRKTRGEEEKK